MNKSYQPRSRKNIKLAVTSMIAAFALIWQMGASAVYAQTSEPTAEPSVTPEVQTTPEPTEDPGYEVGYNTQTGMVSYLGASVDSPIENPAAGDMTAQSQPESYEAYARGFLAVYGSQFGLADAENDLVLKSETQPDDRRVVLRFQQMYQEVPVMAGELVVQLDLSGNVISVNGEVLPNIDLATEATVSSEAAAMAGLQLVGGKYDMTSDQLMVTEPELWIYSPQLLGQDDANAYLVWRMDVVSDRDLAVDELVLIDAFAGLPILNFSQIDASKAVQIYDAAGSNTPKVSGTMICDQTTSGSCTGDYSKAYTIASNYYDMLHNYFNRDSLDNAGMALRVYLHSGSGAATYEDGLAFWDGDSVLYMNTKTVANDIVAHEFSHGMIEYTTGLFNYYQSGAISESLADLWGEMYDQIYDPTGTAWLIGEETGTYLRSMINPPAKSQPDKMTNSYYFTGTTDNGGVHTNSGVNNKAIYLMAVGGTFNNYVITGIGLPKVAAIYYEAQSHLLTSGSDYNDMYNLIYQACTIEIGVTPYGATSFINRSDCDTVKKVLQAVEMNQQPVSGFNTNPVVCDSIRPNNTLYSSMEDYSAFETDWTISGGWEYDGALDLYGENAHDGVHFLQISTGSNSMLADAVTRSVTIPSNAYLYFYQDYDFQSGKDGGVIEYSTNGGGTWTDAGYLIDASVASNNFYDGTISAASRQAFTGTSHGYIGTRLNLSSLAGQSARFRWRVYTDATTPNGRGWWLDDVRIYTCSQPPNVNIYIGNSLQGGYFVDGNGRTIQRYSGLMNGPVRVASTDGQTFVASEQVQFPANNPTSFNEVMGIPTSQLTTEYWFTWYDDQYMYSWILVGNPSASETAIVYIYIGAREYGPYNIAPGGKITPRFVGIMDGPVRVVSTNGVKIFTSERVHFPQTTQTGFNELMGFPSNQLTTEYWFPWYDNVYMYSWVMVGNPSSTNVAKVEIYIGGVKYGPYDIQPGGRITPSYTNVNNGPVRVVSTNGQVIFTSERVHFPKATQTSFNEVMGYPANQFTTTYYYPDYNDVMMYTWLIIGNPSSTQTAEVDVYMAGEKWDHYQIAPGGRVTPRFNISNGPVKVVSTNGVNIFTSERAHYPQATQTGFNEVMGVPANQLSNEYWFTWYDDSYMKSWLYVGK